MATRLGMVEAGGRASASGWSRRRARHPCLLVWTGGEPSPAALAEMLRASRRREAGVVLVAVDRATQLLLVPDRAGAPTARRVALAAAQAALASVAHAAIEVVLGAPIGPGEDLALVASRLQSQRAEARPREAVDVRADPLGWLLARLDTRQAAAFVDRQLAPLAAYDHEHGTDLQRVVELALDHPNRNQAADAAYMHRNTFRRQLRTALGVLDADLDRPEERLALHLALKLRAGRVTT